MTGMLCSLSYEMIWWLTCWTGWPAHAWARAAVASPAALVARPGDSPSNVCISCCPAVVRVDAADAAGTAPPLAAWLSTCCWGWFSWDVEWPPDRSLGFFLGLGLTRSDACRPVVLRYVCNSSLYAICSQQTDTPHTTITYLLTFLLLKCPTVAHINFHSVNWQTCSLCNKTSYHTVLLSLYHTVLLRSSNVDDTCLSYVLQLLLLDC